MGGVRTQEMGNRPWGGHLINLNEQEDLMLRRRVGGGIRMLVLYGRSSVRELIDLIGLE